VDDTHYEVLVIYDRVITPEEYEHLFDLAQRTNSLHGHGRLPWKDYNDHRKYGFSFDIAGREIVEEFIHKLEKLDYVAFVFYGKIGTTDYKELFLGMIGAREDAFDQWFEPQVKEALLEIIDESLLHDQDEPYFH